ncbi:unnamed protein product [Blepharisma stoltei]|uniref:Uncharacterized protein n=1 Tax=Blepharisma stoltei TaxID=1481888 RepID=A0AAU9KA66_9CILI|nr:unnamed protein product [Blepharisma stoltei]
MEQEKALKTEKDHLRVPYHKHLTKSALTVNNKSAGNSPCNGNDTFSNNFLQNKKPWETIFSTQENFEDSPISDRLIQKTSKAMAVFEEFGIYNDLELKPLLQGIDPNAEHTPKRKTITLADLWGQKLTQRLLSSPRLRKAANIMRHKYLQQAAKSSNSFTNPDKPHIMDQHAQTRVFIKQNEVSKNDELPALKAKTSRLIITSDVGQKKAKALKQLHSIMNSCDQLYKKSVESKIKIPLTSREGTRAKKLKKKDIQMINIFKKKLN